MDDNLTQSQLGLTIASAILGPITLNSVLGVGSFAVVYLGESKDSIQYAVKCLFKHNLTESQLRLQHTEATLHASLDHDNIVALYDTVDTEDCLFLVLEYCDTDLFDVLQNRAFTDTQVKDAFGQICDAVQYMHAKDISHRDLKPENVLIKYQKDGSPVFKVADFGLAVKGEWGDLGLGTLRYMPPESLVDSEKTHINGMVYNRGTDTWALGVVLINLLTGSNPWTEPTCDDEVYAAFTEGGIDVLVHAFGFTREFGEVLSGIFCEWSDRSDAAELKTGVQSLGKFFDVSGFVDSSADTSRSVSVSWRDELEEEMDYGVLPVFGDEQEHTPQDQRSDIDSAVDVDDTKKSDLENAIAALTALDINAHPATEPQPETQETQETQTTTTVAAKPKPTIALAPAPAPSTKPKPTTADKHPKLKPTKQDPQQSCHRQNHRTRRTRRRRRGVRGGQCLAIAPLLDTKHKHQQQCIMAGVWDCGIVDVMRTLGAAC